MPAMQSWEEIKREKSASLSQVVELSREGGYILDRYAKHYCYELIKSNTKYPDRIALQNKIKELSKLRMDTQSECIIEMQLLANLKGERILERSVIKIWQLRVKYFMKEIAQTSELRWKEKRFLWIAFFKGNDGCYLSILPKDVILHIQYYINVLDRSQRNY